MVHTGLRVCLQRYTKFSDTLRRMGRNFLKRTETAVCNLSDFYWCSKHCSFSVKELNCNVLFLYYFCLYIQVKHLYTYFSRNNVDYDIIYFVFHFIREWGSVSASSHSYTIFSWIVMPYFSPTHNFILKGFTEFTLFCVYIAVNKLNIFPWSYVSAVSIF